MFKYSLLLGLYSLVHLTKIIIISIDFFNCCRGGVVILINADSTDKHNHFYFLLVLCGCYNSTINHSVVGHLFHNSQFDSYSVHKVTNNYSKDVTGVPRG